MVALLRAHFIINPPASPGFGFAPFGSAPFGS